MRSLAMWGTTGSSNATEVVAVSTADKLGSAGPYVVGPVEELTYLVTDASAPPERLDGFRAAGIEVILA
jgi:DeoR/GlpR family transcriptional regulator of sugar metabolism